MRERENSKSAESVATRYAALMALVEISNRIGAIDWIPKERSKTFAGINDWIPDAHAMRALKTGMQALARSQRAAGTPEALRIQTATLATDTVERPIILLSRPAPLRSWRMPAAHFYADIQSMQDVLARIARFAGKQSVTRDSEDMPTLVVVARSRLLDIKPDFTIDAGPELFTDTLLRALAGRDVRRIRQCPDPECRNLFVAVPSDKVACSRECASAQRVRSFLKTHPGYYAREQRLKRAKRHIRPYAKRVTA